MQRSTLHLRPTNIFPSSFYEQVTFLSRNASNQSTFTSYTLTRVRRKKIDDEEQVKRGLVGISRLAFVIGQDQLDAATGGSASYTSSQGTTFSCTPGVPGATPVPKPRDILVDANNIAYTIPDKGIDRPLLANAHDCAVLVNPG